MKLTLCGSTRFMEQFHRWNQELTLCGHVVYSVATSVHGDWTPTEEQKTILDLVHLRKIHESHAIVVINELGYIGDSTRREIQWADINEKFIYVTDYEQRDSIVEVVKNSPLSPAHFLLAR